MSFAMTNHLSRAPQENFVTEFLNHCEEYDVEPLPRFVIKNGMEQFATFEPEKTFEEDSPIFHVYFENARKMENEVSICILDALNTTLQKYNTITVLKLPNCQINAYGILQIAQMLSEYGCIKDLNLDNNPNVQENYYFLCAPARNLHYLSLKMCKLSDNGIKKIAHELKYRDPPNKPKLIALNLAENEITDIGAEHIAAMLRTNRSLQSIVLTGNKIHDDGALLIIHELCMSTLTHEEIVDLRRRRFIELESKLDKQDTEETSVTSVQWKKNKMRQRQNLINSNHRNDSSKIEIKTNSSSMSINSNQNSEKLSNNNISHPFMRETMAIKDCVMASGNLELQHLSLSFNRLTNKTLKKLVSCLYYQNYMLLNDSTRGLLHVFLEGNDIQKNEDWTTFQELLRCRQGSQIIQDDDFTNLVPVDSEILRSKISIAE